MNAVVDRERLLAELARREGGQQGPPLIECEESTICEVAAGLNTLTEVLTQPPPLDEFAEESDCRRATEWVEQLKAPPEHRRPEHIPEHIGPYRVVGRLGQGGMGAVLKAVHPRLHRDVAIKTLPAASLQDAKAIERFSREMAAVGTLRHPNIVTAHDAGEVDGMHYLVMEYVDGVDLSTLVRQVGPLAPADACEIVRQAASGLAAAHAQGIVHRDVKPSNIMLSDSGTADGTPTVKVLDFGLALLAPRQAGDRELTSAGQIMGTVNYMAPEQCSESRTVDKRADVYSLGATLYRLLGGRPPFGDDRLDSPMSLLEALATEKPTPLAQLRSDLPPQVIAVVERMMAKDPADRFDSAHEVAEILTPYSAGARLDRLIKKASEQSADGDLAWHVKHTPSRSHADSPMRSSWGRFVLLGIAAVVAAVGAFCVWPSAGHWPDLLAILHQPGAEDRAAQRRSRQVAQWLSEQRATYGIYSDETGYLEVATGLQPPTYPFLLETVDLTGNRSLRDADLERLNGLSELAMLNLADTNISDEDLHHLTSLPKLVHLFLSSTQITDDGLRTLANCKQLQTLYLTATSVSDTGLATLIAFQNLKELSLHGCQVTDEGLKHLESLANLERLWLAGTRVTPHGIARLQQALPNCHIDSLNIDQRLSTAQSDLPISKEAAYRNSRLVAEWLSSIGAAYGVTTPSAGFIQVRDGAAPPDLPLLLNTVNLGPIRTLRDEDLKRFDNLPDLVTLVLNDTDIGDAGLRNLGHLPALDHLYLSGTRVTDSGLAELKRFPQLTTLHLYATAVTNAGLKHLMENKQLTELQLVGCLISDAGIDDLKRLQGLKLLYLQNTAVTARGVAELREALPDCEIDSGFSDDHISTASDDSTPGGRGP